MKNFTGISKRMKPGEAIPEKIISDLSIEEGGLYSELSHRLEEKYPAGGYTQEQVQECYSEVYNEKYGSPIERRYDHIAFMVQNIDPCGAACFDGERLLISTNEKCRPSKPKPEGKPKRFTFSASGEPQQAEVVGALSNNYERFHKPMVDMVKSYLEFVVSTRKKIKRDPENSETYQDMLYEEMQTVIGKMNKLMTEAAGKPSATPEEELDFTVKERIEDFRISIEKVTGSLLHGSKDPLPVGVINAIRNGRVEFIEQAIPDQYGRRVHAELRIVNELIKSEKLGKGEQYRVGISKRCCLICEHVIASVNEVMAKKSGVVPIVEEIRVRSTGHKSYYPAAIPDFLKPDSGLLPEETRAEIEAVFRKNMQTEPDLTFESIFNGGFISGGLPLGYAPRSPSPPAAFGALDEGAGDSVVVTAGMSSSSSKASSSMLPSFSSSSSSASKIEAGEELPPSASALSSGKKAQNIKRKQAIEDPEAGGKKPKSGLVGKEVGVGGSAGQNWRKTKKGRAKKRQEKALRRQQRKEARRLAQSEEASAIVESSVPSFSSKASSSMLPSFSSSSSSASKIEAGEELPPSASALSSGKKAQKIKRKQAVEGPEAGGKKAPRSFTDRLEKPKKGSSFVSQVRQSKSHSPDIPGK